MLAALTLAVLLTGRQGTQSPFPFLSGWFVPAKGEGVGDGGRYLGSQIPDRGSDILLPGREPRAESREPLPAQLLALSAYQSPAAPEFVAAKGDWIQKPVSLKSLKGKVVIVDFWAYTCVNCIRTFPYVNGWYKRYHDKGFEVVAIHRPEFDFEADPKNVAKAAKRFGFKFPVLNDPKGKNWDNYRVEAWPTKILVDGNGKIVYQHVGEGSYDEFEKRIQQQLALLHPGAKFGAVMSPVRPTDAPGAVCQPCTLEAYAASTNTSHFSADQRGKKSVFTYPSKRTHGFYYNGAWTPTRSYVEENGNAAFAFNYMAKDVNVVLRPTSGSIVAQVYQDGRPLAANELGDDVKMVGGVPTMKVDEPRMYSVIRNPKWGMHDLEIRFKNPGARLYTLTFGTDCRPLPRKKR